MDAAGSERAVVFATWEATPVALLFAAAYPERVSALILSDTYVRYTASDEMPWLPIRPDSSHLFVLQQPAWRLHEGERRLPIGGRPRGADYTH
jgi:pimeloyl-ACP methyl ester carboxylesterase